MNENRITLFHINNKSSIGKDLLYKSLLKSIFEEDLDEIEKPNYMDINAAKSYLSALRILDLLVSQNMCTYTANNIHKKYPLHCIYIHWKDIDGFINPPIKQLCMLCNLMDNLLISNTEGADWQFSKEIYKIK